MSTETKAYDGKYVTNTLAGMSVQNSLTLGLPIDYPEKSTLNEHRSILRDRLPDPEARPLFRYLAIGNGGHVVTADDVLATPVPIRHEPTDAAPYNMIPFVLRPVDKDLGDDVRPRYALRRLEEHGDKRYWAYYLRRLDWRGVTTKRYYRKVSDGQESIVEFEYSDLNLFPKPPEMPDYDYDVDDSAVSPDGDYVHASAAIEIGLDRFDIEELLNVAKVLYGNPNKAVVSEFCLCSGVDTVATGESMVGSPFTYDEAIGVQVAMFMTTFTNVAFVNRSHYYTIDFGQTEAMLMAPGQVPQQLGGGDGSALI